MLHFEQVKEIGINIMHVWVMNLMKIETDRNSRIEIDNQLGNNISFITFVIKIYSKS